MQETVQILYSCKECRLKDRMVTIQARANEDVIQWTEGVLLVGIAKDHSIKSPFCTAKEITEVKIPISEKENAGIGSPAQWKKDVQN